MSPAAQSVGRESAGLPGFRVPCVWAAAMAVAGDTSVVQGAWIRARTRQKHTAISFLWRGGFNAVLGSEPGGRNAEGDRYMSTAAVFPVVRGRGCGMQAKARVVRQASRCYDTLSNAVMYPEPRRLEAESQV